MATLETVQGGSFVPDLASAFKIGAAGFEKRRQENLAEEKKQDILTEIDTITRAGEDPREIQRARVRLAAIDPKVAQAVTATIESGNQAAIAKMKEEAERGLRNATVVQSKKTFAEKQRTFKDIVLDKISKGLDVSRDLEILNSATEDQFNNEMQRRIVAGTDIATLTKVPDPFTLSPGQTRFGPGGEEIAQVAPASKQLEPFTLSPGQQRFPAGGGESIANVPPAPAKPPEGFTLTPGQQRFDAQGRPIASVPSVVPTPKLLKGKAGESFFDQQGNLKFKVPGIANGIKLSPKDRENFTAESMDTAAGPGGKFSDLKFTTEAIKRLNSGGIVKIGAKGLVKIGDKVFFGTQVISPDGSSKVALDAAGGDIVAPQTGLTLAEEQAEKAKGAGAKTTEELQAQAEGRPDVIKAETRTKGTETRIQASIKDGINAAKSLAPLKRSLDLIKVVGTGKPQEAILKFQQLFGFAPADETELQSSLQIEVLKQIRPIFGAQPSKEEGLILLDLNTNFGKSTEGNIRLLNRAIALINERVGVGLNDAKTAGDQNAIDRINRAMQFEIKPEGATQESGGITPEQKQRLEQLRQKQR